MPPRPRLPLAAPALAFLVLGTAASSALAKDTTPDPWAAALRFDYSSAAKGFSRLHAASPDDPRAALGLASALLGRQPRTQANILEARQILEQVAATSPADSSFALAARLLLGRIAEDHLVPPRPEEARERYESLLREHAGRPLADQAAVHLALIAAFRPPGEAPLESTALHARIDELRAAVRSPGVVRELHALQASLLLQEQALSAALPHLLAARAIGYRQADRNSDADLSIAEIARETGDAALAVKHYRAFLAARPRDSRASTVRRHVAELESAAAPAPSATARP